MKLKHIIFAVLIILAGVFVYSTLGGYGGRDAANIGDNDTSGDLLTTIDENNVEQVESQTNSTTLLSSSREIIETEGVKHSIPLDEIIGGGPRKDGIPSIDDPKFIDIEKAEKFLIDTEIGLALSIGGTDRFYPYQILVFHELVNDTLEGKPVLITYCPLCATGIVYDRQIDGEVVEFGVSGFLWQSNLVMYDRVSSDEKGPSSILGGLRGASLSDFDADKQSLWSQVLGEAVWGAWTGKKLTIISSDTIRFGDWKEKNPKGEVLSRETGVSRSYGRDPYGGNTPIIGAVANDDRLAVKAFVLGVEIEGQYKAYLASAIPEGESSDSFAGEDITIERSSIGEVRMFIGSDRTPLPYIGGYWFSWAAVHPTTEVFK